MQYACAVQTSGAGTNPEFLFLLFFYGTTYYVTRISTYKRNKIGNLRITKHCSVLTLFLYFLGYEKVNTVHPTKALLWRFDIANSTYLGLHVKCPTILLLFLTKCGIP